MILEAAQPGDKLNMETSKIIVRHEWSKAVDTLNAEVHEGILIPIFWGSVHGLGAAVPKGITSYLRNEFEE